MEAIGAKLDRITLRSQKSEENESLILMKLEVILSRSSGAAADGSPMNHMITNTIPSELLDLEGKIFIGKGGQGSVFKSKLSIDDGKTCVDVALKVVPGNDKSAVRALEKESRLLRKLNHRNIVQFYGVSFHAVKSVTYVVLGLCECGDFDFILQIFGRDTSRLNMDKLEALWKLLKCNPRLAHTLGAGGGAANTQQSQEDGGSLVRASRQYLTSLLGGEIGTGEVTQAFVNIFFDVTDALAYIHGHGIIHGDLKPANILLHHSGKACLSDFGLAKVIANSTMGSMSMTYSGGSMSALAGTATYAAPELEKSFPSDVFSLALVNYSLLTGRVPFDHLRDVFQIILAVRNGERPLFPETVRQELIDFLTRMGSQEPSHRPTIRAIMAIFEGSKHTDDLALNYELMRWAPGSATLQVRGREV
jgi:serine/threonine protein kinase